MLSPTDIHYLVGFLYVVSRREDISVVLGERVFDEASESKRDVDIVIATDTTMALLGVEVKDETRPLDTPLVESLCQKLRDMPSLTRRAIVSTSGYSAPALRKARHHGVECLRLVRGCLPRFPTIDLSALSAFTVAYPVWRQGPCVAIAPQLQLSADQRAAVTPGTVVRFPNGEIVRFKDLPARFANLVTTQWDAGPHPRNLANVTVDIDISDAPTVLIGALSFSVPNARVTGVLDWVTETVLLEGTCYLSDADGEPFAATALVAIHTGLLGLSVSIHSQELRLFHLPQALRAIRPVRHPLHPTPGGPAAF